MKIKFIAILFFVYGCAPFEVLPGLCYTDKDGTYLCPEDLTEELFEPEFDIEEALEQEQEMRNFEIMKDMENLS